MNNSRETGYSPEQSHREKIESSTEVEVINQLKWDIADRYITAFEGQGFSEIEGDYLLDNQPTDSHAQIQARFVSRLGNISEDEIVVIVGRAEDIPIDEGNGNPLRFRAWQGALSLPEGVQGRLQNPDQEFVVDWEYRRKDEPIARAVLSARVQAMQRAIRNVMQGITREG